MSKRNKTSFEIFFESLKLYISNFDKFVKYMTFPVLGQIAGLSIVFFLSYFYAKNIPNLIAKFPELSDINILLLLAILIMLPGLAIFVKAFWEYLVAYGAINSMLDNMLKSGKVYDFDAHTELIKRRTLSFVGLWFLFSLFSLLALVPFFWVPCAVFAIYFVLIFQVFTFEPDLSPLGCVKKSLMLVKGHFLSTLLLYTLIGLLTYCLLPQIANVFCEYTHISLFLKNLLKPVLSEISLSEVNTILAIAYIPPLNVNAIVNFTVSTLIAQIFIQYTLPLRSILWGVWYKFLENKIPKQKCSKKNSKKKSSENLISESRKKFGSKKLDKNILRRAMEKDE